ncbi:MAG TPA: hypothetical protein VE398_19525 [Acidobacteriota bacterium]|nr:hypothetical protein [Acidobacteriota bacterium]
MDTFVSTKEFYLLCTVLWLACALLSFVNGLIRRLHTYQWLAISLLFGPIALLIGMFLLGRGPRVSLFSREDSDSSTHSKRNIGDPFTGKPLYSDEVRELKRQGRLREAADLLTMLIDLIEEKGKKEGRDVPRWYYEQLASIQRREGKSSAEEKTLERYAASRRSAGRKDKLLSRLERLKQKDS